MRMSDIVDHNHNLIENSYSAARNCPKEFASDLYKRAFKDGREGLGYLDKLIHVLEELQLEYIWKSAGVD